MKKTLLLGMLLLAGLGAKAQEGGLPDGSVAPDFTATDINGNTHHLQEYLDAGKTVVLYISATWCGPCWQFHNTHYLRDIYDTFGQGGSNEVVILYVEGDPGTTQADLEGTGPNTQGNWIEGSPYPIIDNATIAGSTKYDIDFFPTIYRICPGETGQPGTTTQIARNTPPLLRESIEDNCHDLLGVPGWGSVAATDLRFCDSNGVVRGTISNLGTDISTATANLKVNGETVSTQTFTFEEPVRAFGSDQFTFEGVTIDDTAEYQIELVSINDGTLHDTSAEATTTDTFGITLNGSLESTQNVNITIHTDKYPAEMRVFIVDQATPTIAKWSKTYTNIAANKNKTFVYSNVVLDANACYDVYVVDTYGDGWADGTTGVYGMKIETAGSASTVLYSNDGDIGPGSYNQAVFRTNDVLGNKEFTTSKFSIYPNPSTGIFNFATEEAVDVTIVDITGKTVYTNKAIEDGASIDLSFLQTGMYIAKIKGDTVETVEKLIIK